MEKTKDPMSYELKDEVRIKDLFKRSKGNDEKLLQLARNMASAIKDPLKAARRGNAAKSLVNVEELHNIFFNRALQLSGKLPEKKSVIKEISKEIVKEPVKEQPKVEEEIFAPDFQRDKVIKRDYRKSFWKDRYNDRATNEQKDILNHIFGYNQSLWKLISKQGFNWEDLKVETIQSKWENDTPGYVGRFSGDVIAQRKGTVKIFQSGTFYNTWTEYYDTSGFW